MGLGPKPDKLSPADALLFRAISKGKLADLKKAFNDGADINALNRKGYAPLHEAVNHNFGQGVEFLIKQGADLGLKNGQGFTPRELASLLKYPFVEGMLVMAEQMSGVKAFQQNEERLKEQKVKEHEAKVKEQQSDERLKKNLSIIDGILNQKRRF